LCPGDKQSFGVGERRAKTLTCSKPRSLAVTVCQSDISEEDYFQLKQWLKETSQPRVLVQQYLVQTCHRRQVEIQCALSDGKESIHDILTQWPKLKESCYVSYISEFIILRKQHLKILKVQYYTMVICF